MKKECFLTYKDEDAFVGKRITKETIDTLEKSWHRSTYTFVKTSLVNRVFGGDVIDPETGEVVVEQGTILTEETFEQLKEISKSEVYAY